MARRGSFGRLPRSAPNLSVTIVAMLREYNNMIDQNMVEAWKNGGLVDGKKVTDDSILAHWKSRRDSVSQDDPLWDYYNNMVRDYDYSIAESKMSLKYAEKKVSDSQMASFYRTWARKLPTDSEAYRTLMRNAAQFTAAARSRGAAGAAAARAKAYNDGIVKSWEKHEAAYDYTMNLLIGAAKADGILAPNEDLADLRVAIENDPTAMLHLIDKINNGEWPASPEAAAKVKAQLKAYDPTFSGSLTYDYINTLTGQKLTGINERVDLARKTGHDSDAKKWTKDAADAVKNGGIIAGWDELAIYYQLRTNYKSVMEDPKSTYADRLEASKQYKDNLTELRNRVSMQTTGKGDVVTNPLAGLFTNEINALDGDTSRGGPTAWESNAKATGSETAAKDSAGMAAAINADRQTALNIATGKELLVQGVYSTSGQFMPSPSGTAWGTMPREQASQFTSVAIPITTPVVYVTVTSADGKETQSVPSGGKGFAVVPTTPITVQGVTDVADPITGALGQKANPIAGRDTKVGEVAVINGVTVYGIYATDGSGKKYWQSTNPFSEAVLPGQTIGKDGMVVTVKTAAGAGYDPQAAINPTANNPTLENNERYTNAWLAAMTASDEGKRQLNSMSSGDAWDFILKTSASPAEAQASYAEYTKALAGSNNYYLNYIHESQQERRDQAARITGLAVANGISTTAAIGLDAHRGSTEISGGLYAGDERMPLAAEEERRKRAAENAAQASAPYRYNVLGWLTGAWQGKSDASQPEIKIPSVPQFNIGTNSGTSAMYVPRPPVAPTPTPAPGPAPGPAAGPTATPPPARPPSTTPTPSPAPAPSPNIGTNSGTSAMYAAPIPSLGSGGRGGNMPL